MFFSICHSAQLLISADTIRDRIVTGWTSIIPDIQNAGFGFYLDTDGKNRGI